MTCVRGDIRVGGKMSNKEKKYNEEIVTENSVQTVAETEKNIETEQNSETETEEKHQPEDAVRTAANQARASYTIKVGDTLAGISEMYYGMER